MELKKDQLKICKLEKNYIPPWDILPESNGLSLTELLKEKTELISDLITLIA